MNAQKKANNPIKYERVKNGSTWSLYNVIQLFWINTDLSVEVYSCRYPNFPHWWQAKMVLNFSMWLQNYLWEGLRTQIFSLQQLTPSIIINGFEYKQKVHWLKTQIKLVPPLNLKEPSSSPKKKKSPKNAPSTTKYLIHQHRWIEIKFTWIFYVTIYSH